MDLITEAGAQFLHFLGSLPAGKDTDIHVLCDSDADGLPAAAILVRALQASGYARVTAAPRGKAESAWSPSVIARLRDRAPAALFVLDLGSRPEPLLPDVPTMLIDHHAPHGVPEGATLLTGYGTEPTPTTGLLAYWCAQALVGEQVASDWLWLAAISLLSDLGDKAPFEELRHARAQYKMHTLREATALLNAPRRSSSGDARFALQVLLNATSPAQILSGELPETAALVSAKEEVAAALAHAKKGRPHFSQKFREQLGGDIVAIQMHTPCQVHPLVAQIWRGRFPRNIVMGVNCGYRPGFVHFSARAPKAINLIQFLRAHSPPGADATYGSGHDQASGGSLSTSVWNQFAADLGFGPELQVTEKDAQVPEVRSLTPL